MDNRRILLIEDDPDDAELIITGLRRSNLANEIDLVRDGVEALDYLYRRGNYAGRSGADPLLILLDLKMPRLDGRQVLRQVKSDNRLRHLPVVVLTSSAHEKDVAMGYDLGANACRILVPGYSEIYPVEDLIWDNTNKALLFRSDILNLHSLSDMRLRSLLKSLEQCEVDDYTDITTLIGVEFDDNTVWGQLTILELKLLIYLALNKFDEAKELTEAFLQYNDNTVERGLFYQALNVVLEVQLDDELDMADFEPNFRRMFGNERMDAAIGSVNGSVRFYGLTPTSMQLEGLDKHLRLIDSYKKLHSARARAAGLAG